jgi:hypothetical protein
MKFCRVVPEICCGQVHGPQKERRKRRKRRIIIIIIIIRNRAKTISLPNFVCLGDLINYLTLMLKSHKGHYGTRHTALWSCTHIPNIIDLSGKTKKLWFGQASLRRSRRKNQTKTICLPLFEGET